MALILFIIVPIFGLIALGYAAGRSRILPDSAPEALSAFVFVIGMPTVLFRTLATASFEGGSPLALWATYFAAVALTYGLGIVAARRFGRVDRRAAVIAGLGASFSNLVFVGVPVASLAFGEAGLSKLAMLLAIHLPLMMMASTLLVERAALLDRRDAGDSDAQGLAVGAIVLRVGRNLVRSPLILGVFAGLAWRATGLPLGGPLGEIVRMLATATGPLALFALGLTMTRFKVRGDLRMGLIIAFLALVLQPAAALVVGTFLLPPDWLVLCVAMAACPSGANAWLFANYFRSGESLAATVIVTTTALSAVTLSFWLVAL
ncbi:AEC family transporter [Aureimonas frigidaquae]|uniref:Putative auxin efflux carrier family protein n=1 Tax=Aureimonas frigidaquae TaxID=424757 RepID=A0A0P0Z057_9HYPH|nr:AEC family transporter [Aureimonas frigidaquae]BAT27208.1 putative auxin efflux carrier family protein [Aureimonas frigidaquae]